MNRNELNPLRTQHLDTKLVTFDCHPVDSAELVGIAGGVGPVFDVSKVEGPSLPSWYLPVSPRISITTIR